MSLENSSDYQQHNIIGKIATYVHNFASQILILAMTVMIANEVVFRYFLGAGFKWTQEVCGLAFLLLVFLCQANTWQKNHHIRMDIFYNRFNDKLKAFSNFIGAICGIILYISIVYQGIIDFKYQFETAEGTDELMWPLWPFSLVMILSSLLVVILLLTYLYSMFFRNNVK